MRRRANKKGVVDGIRIEDLACGFVVVVTWFWGLVYSYRSFLFFVERR